MCIRSKAKCMNTICLHPIYTDDLIDGSCISGFRALEFRTSYVVAGEFY